MKQIRYETPINHIDKSIPSIFLAGPTVRGNQPHLTSWRFEAVELFEKNAFDGNIIIPEFSDKTESDKYRYDLPVWENETMTLSDVIMFWVSRTRELIALTTNHEFGYWMARNRDGMIYGRPDTAYRIIYNDIMWVEDSKWQKKKCPIYNTLPKTVDAALALCKQRFSSL